MRKIAVSLLVLLGLSVVAPNMLAQDRGKDQCEKPRTSASANDPQGLLAASAASAALFGSYVMLRRRSRKRS